MPEMPTIVRRLAFNETDFVDVTFSPRPAVVSTALAIKDDPESVTDTSGGVWPQNFSPLDADPHRAHRMIFLRALAAGATPGTILNYGSVTGPKALVTAAAPDLPVTSFGTIAEAFGDVSEVADAEGVTVTSLPESWALVEPG